MGCLDAQWSRKNPLLGEVRAGTRNASDLARGIARATDLANGERKSNMRIFSRHFATELDQQTRAARRVEKTVDSKAAVAAGCEQRRRRFPMYGI